MTLTSIVPQVMGMALPPRKRRHAACRCSITGARLGPEEGLEILKKKDDHPQRSSSSDVVVHLRFTHFFSMLWLVCRVDHILRNMARAWMASEAAEAGRAGDDDAAAAVEGGNTLLHREKKEEVEEISLCQKFSEHHAKRIESMGIMFRHAASHVERSLAALQTCNEMETSTF